MKNSAHLISIFHTGVTICLVLAVIFLILSIILFFKLNIREIWEMKSGRAREKAIREKQKEASISGKLRFQKKAVPTLEPSEHLKQEESEDTMVLKENEVEVSESNQTPLNVQTASCQLKEGNSLTEVLNQKDKESGKGRFLIIKQICYIHTEEVI